MRQHGVVQRDPARHEALRLGVVLAVDQPHELAHDVHVVPGRPERVLRHQPAVGEDHEVDVGRAGRLGRRGQHGEDRRVGVVEQDRADRASSGAGRTCRARSCRARRRRRAASGRASAAQSAPPHFTYIREGASRVLVGGDRRQEVARVGQAVGADRPALGQRERAAVVLAQIAAGRPARELDPDLHAARDDGDLAGLDVDDAELGPEPQLALLRHEQHLAVGVVEVLVLHRAGDRGRHARPCRPASPASPAVVMVRTPSRKDSGSVGIGIGSQRIGAIGTSTSGRARCARGR